MNKKILLLIFLFLFQFLLFSEDSYNCIYNNIESLDKLYIRILDIQNSDNLSNFIISIDDIPDNLESFFVTGGFPISACEKEPLFYPGNLTSILLYEKSLFVSLKEELSLQFQKILEDNPNKYIALTNGHIILGCAYTNKCYVSNNHFYFVTPNPDKLYDDDFLDKIRLSAVMIIDSRKKITDFLDIPFYTNMEDAIKILDERNYNFKIFQKTIIITDDIIYNGKTITECDLSFSFDKLISFEAKFEEEFSNEPSLDEYVNEYVSNFRMKKSEDDFIFSEYISCSGINLLVDKLIGTSIQLYDKEKSTIAYEIEQNKDAPLGYNKWSISRFKLLANDYIDEEIMFDKMRIYDLSDDGNYITLIDYYDNSIKVKISPEDKTKELINRIIYLFEQRQINHEINCFADFYGHIGIDDNKNPIFFIEMID